MAPWTIEEIGARLTGSIILFHLDNTSSDKRFLGDIFRAPETACGPIDVDACSHPLGRNYSAPPCGGRSAAASPMTGPDSGSTATPPRHARALVNLRHFRACYAAAPSTTSGTFVFPLPHLRLAGRPTLNPCKDESIGAIVERRITRPTKGRLPLRIPDLRAMLHRGFSLSSASVRHQRLCITFMNLGCLRRKAAAALTSKYRVSGSGAVSYA
eukprot:jgi/Tetstr1/426759/TSEL_001696.t1